MRTSDFHFHLPPELIAQLPAPNRDQSRLLVLHREAGEIEHRRFQNLPDFLRTGDVLVLNNSRVIPARLRGHNTRTGGQFEMLLLEENAANDWWVLLRPGKRAPIGTEIIITAGRSGDQATPPPAREICIIPPGLPPSGSNDIRATVIETNDEGHRRLRFGGTQNIFEMLELIGEVPLPPYIAPDPSRAEQDRERYQTVYAQPAGSVAAPTAGLHFTNALLSEVRARGVQVCFVTLHVGLGTFSPVKAETLAGHKMHEERFELSAETAQAVNAAKTTGRRIVAVGTTTVRVLESVAAANAGQLVAGAGRTSIFIYPPRNFAIADALLTNFHLPCSTLLMLASAFAAPGEARGREMVLAAYAEAIRERYRFFSYGDAMLLL